MKKILAFSGSARKASFNKKLIKIAAEGARREGLEVNLIDLADYPMPLFCEDLEAEQGIPESALAFKALLLESNAIMIASPEYNSAFSPLLKNAIDWASRTSTDNEPPLAAFKGKYATIMSASPGGLGGMRGLVFLRMLLGNLGMIVLPEQQAVGNAYQVFSEDGSIADETLHSKIIALGESLADVVLKL